LSKFFRGEVGGLREKRISSQIKKLIICGNSITEPKEQDQVNRGSFRAHDLNLQVYQELVTLTDQFEDFVDEVAQFIDIDIMPGE